MRELTTQIELTPEQVKAFRRLKKAFNDCKNAGVRFEMSQENLIAMNGECVVTVYEGTPYEDNHLELDDCAAHSLETGICPWVDCDVTVEVKSNDKGG